MIQNISLTGGNTECWAKQWVVLHMKQMQSTSYMLISYSFCNEYQYEMC